MRILGSLFIFLMAFGVLGHAQPCSRELELVGGNVVEIKGNQIVVNGEPQTQLYGAEFQYFRLRGGYGRNVPRAKVIETWKRGLDEMVEAGMNSISFYIPWDFHEYAPGKFDFTGTVDEDGDGRPDYPSRDILTFLRMVEERGIKKILLRPGPYVNAEWGYLGFGAIPEWFHKRYPESHMQNAQGLRTKLFDYHNADFLRHTKLWFKELNRQVLTHVIGKGKPAIFLQLDNETNFQWQSIYTHDYGPGAIARYQGFLKNRYRSLAALNKSQGTAWNTWKDVAPPVVAGKNLMQDQDWYRFQDWSIFTYLNKIRNIWEEIGVTEPNVIFTLAESFNAPKNGLLPNYKFKNKEGATGLMSVNIYPKTFPAPPDVLLHQPYKSDYDMIAVASANRYYLGSDEEAVIGPEIDTGWFGKTVLSEDARKQTYLTLIGRGLKAQFFYYFSEGYNWQVEWGRNQILPYYRALHSDPRYSKIPAKSLPDLFWNELQPTVDREFMVGWDAKAVILEDVKAAQKLHFGTPLNKDAWPTNHFALVKEIGRKIIKPYGAYLSKTVSLRDKVAILADSGSVTPSPIQGIDSRELHSDFAGGLVGYLLQAGLNPSIHHWGINSTRELAQNKIIFLQDSGNMNPRMILWLAAYAAGGGTVVSFVGDSLARQIGAPATSAITTQPGAVPLTYRGGAQNNANSNFEGLGASVGEYNLHGNPQAQPILFWGDKAVGYKYQLAKGTLVQLGVVIHDAFNSDAYAFLKDIPQRRAVLEDLMASSAIHSQFRIREGGDRVVVFGRKAPDDKKLWITVKSGLLNKTAFHIQINQSLVSASQNYSVTDVMSGVSQNFDGAHLISDGFPVELGANGSAAFFLTPTN